MQLKTSKAHPQKKPRIAGSLALATCALLNATTQSTQAQGANGWQMDSGLLLYQEQDRVSAVEPAVKISKRLADDRTLAVKLVLDSLTGASPNGASATNQPQTFTRPSGRGDYVTPAGEVPLDDTFKDTRTQVAVSYERPWGELSRLSFGANVSSEYDYTSIGFSGSWQRDFNKRNTTLLIGTAVAADQIAPKGGIPTPFSSMQAANAQQPRDGADDNKTVVDVIVGLTQTINRNVLMQWNYSYSQVDGYQNDPFKIVSVVDANSGSTVDNIYENRPDQRGKHSFYWKTKYYTAWDDSVDFSLRYMTDDWGVDSSTLDLHYRWNADSHWYLEPHLRLYQQSSTDFYRHSVPNDQTLTDFLAAGFLSADYRLAEFDSTTLGIKFGYSVSDAIGFNVRLERYQQRGDNSPSDAVGVQQQMDLFPDLDASIIQFGFSFRW